MLKIAFVIICAVHGIIHPMGFVKAFGLAKMPQLTQPVSRPAGLLWLAATLTFSTMAALFFAETGLVVDSRVCLGFCFPGPRLFRLERREIRYNRQWVGCGSGNFIVRYFEAVKSINPLLHNGKIQHSLAAYSGREGY